MTGYCRKDNRRDRNDKKTRKDIGSYWMTIRKGEDTHV
jgi:hypothetical protein